MNATVQGIAEISSELADALAELGVIEYVTEYGTELERPPLCELILGYVKIGRNSCENESTLFTVTRTPDDWNVTREIPGLHRIVLGHFDTPYGAIGAVRRYHPATEPISGTTPSYPVEVIKEVSPQLASILSEHNLVQYVVDADVDNREVVLSSDDRRSEVYLIDIEGTACDIWFTDSYCHETLGSWENFDSAVEKVESLLIPGDAQ